MTKAEEIKAAIAAVEKIYAEADAEAPRPDPLGYILAETEEQRLERHQTFDKRAEAGRKAIQRLKDDHGARYALSGAHEHRLTMAGVSSTCTAGSWGLMTNWLNAARRKLAKLPQ